MNITLASCFANSTPYLTRYFNQVIALQDALQARGDRLACLWGEGDSADDTLRVLDGARFRINATIIDVAHGGEMYGSVVKAERFRQLAGVGRKIWAEIPKDADVFLWIESDLVWGAETIVALIDHLTTYPAIGPMVLLDRPRWGKRTFYDVWATRKAGRHFQHAPPYHPDYVPDRPFPVDSTGSCLAMRGEIARRVVMDDDVLVGVCRQIHEMGEAVWIDPALSVTHQ